MKIQQFADCPISIPRFDSKECIHIEYKEIVEVDDETGKYLLGMRAFTDDGNLATDFRLVE